MNEQPWGMNGLPRVIRDLLLSLIPTDSDRDEVASALAALRRHRVRTIGPWRAAARYWWELVLWVIAARRSRWSPSSHPNGVSDEGSKMRMTNLLGSVASDLRVALRATQRAPIATGVAFLTVALSVGATTAIFSFADALMLRPLPVDEPDRLIALWHVTSETPPTYSSFSYPDFVELHDRSSALSGVAAYSSLEVQLGEGLDREAVEGQIVSANYFDVLGVRPLAGRAFVADEDRTPNTHPVVVLGRDLWERRYGGDPALLGAEILIESRPFTVVGVMPRSTPSGDLQSDPQLWVPLMMHRTVMPGFRAFGTELFGNRGTHWLDLLGRLADEVEREAAGEELRSIAAAQAEDNPDTNEGWSIRVVRAGDVWGSPSIRNVARLTSLLAAVVVIVLAIACANVANLLLARAATREVEMGVRRAIGAGRARLARLVLTESFALALLGGTAGVALAYWLVGLLPSLGVTADLPALDVRLDGRVLSFALALTVATGTLFGLAPAVRASTVDLGRDGRGSTPGRGDWHLRHGLVIVQVALSLVLLVGAGLTLRTLSNLSSVPLGFATEGVSVADLELSDRHRSATPDDRLALYRRIVAGVSELPGVRTASLAWSAPFERYRMANDILWDAGTADGSLVRTNVDMNVVDVGFFQTLDIPIVLGRPFGPDDVSGSPDVAIVNQALARRLWPDESPLEKTVWSWRPNGPDRALRVVGVAADGRYHRSWQSGDQPFLFLPLAQNPYSMTLLVRGTGGSVIGAPAIRAAVMDADPALPPPTVRPLATAQSEAVRLERASARLLSLFGLLATVIATMGIYGVVSYTVSRRRYEIGVRIALGAGPMTIRRQVVGRSVRPILAGAGIGCGVSLLLVGRLSGLLYGVDPRDPLTFTLVTLSLAAVGVLASYVPAHRAAGVSPLTALGE